MNGQHKLEQILAQLESVCIGYSGGVDSVYLAVTALDVLGADKVLAVTGKSASYPDVQWQTARDVAQQFGLPHLEINTDEMSDANYLANPSNRCYFCKSELWSKLAPLARERGYAFVLDGSNADDAHDYRPGAQAAREQGVRSPLMEAGLTKAEIRELSQARGLPTWDQPSAPCLSSRLPYGLAVTPERLQQVEAAEAIVRAAGFKEFRVRHHGDVARLEVTPDEMPLAVARAGELSGPLLKLGFTKVLLDVEGYRRGALNERLVQLRPSGRSSNVAAAGHAADVAVVDAPIEQGRAMAATLKESGFRYVAVDLSGI